MSWYFASTSYVLSSQHSVCARMWPDNRIFVDSNLACQKMLGMNQQSQRLVEQFERTSSSDICIYVSFARHTDRGVGRSWCLFSLIGSA